MMDRCPAEGLARRLAHRLTIIVASSVALLAACSSQPTLPPPEPVDTAQVDRWVMREYLSDTRRPVIERADQISLDGRETALSWTLPAQGQGLPLVVYLAGLGEAPTAGDVWREAWARAGYAVLTIPNTDADRKFDRTAPPASDDSSAQAVRLRQADQRDALHDWALSRYAPQAAAERLKRCVEVLTAVLARQTANGTPGARIDARRLALAGYDLGAYTAMLAVGEVPRPEWTVPPLPLAVRAVIALSPYADFSGNGFNQRYQGIQVPVLSVSSNADQDMAGVVNSPFVRRAPFEHLGAGSALLWLQGTSHRALAGSTRSGLELPLPLATPPMTGRQEPGLRPHPSTEDAIDQVIVAATTTAFLDAWLKEDAGARSWLAGNPRAWLGQRGEWRTHNAP